MIPFFIFAYLLVGFCVTACMYLLYHIEVKPPLVLVGPILLWPIMAIGLIVITLLDVICWVLGIE